MVSHTKLTGRPEVQRRMSGDGAESVSDTPEAFAELIKIEIAKWGKVVKAAGIPSE